MYKKTVILVQDNMKTLIKNLKKYNQHGELELNKDLNGEMKIVQAQVKKNLLYNLYYK